MLCSWWKQITVNLIYLNTELFLIQCSDCEKSAGFDLSALPFSLLQGHVKSCGFSRGGSKASRVFFTVVLHQRATVRNIASLYRGLAFFLLKREIGRKSRACAVLHLWLETNKDLWVLPPIRFIAEVWVEIARLLNGRSIADRLWSFWFHWTSQFPWFNHAVVDHRPDDNDYTVFIPIAAGSSL